MILQRANGAREQERGRSMSLPSTAGGERRYQDTGFGDFIRVSRDVPFVRRGGLGRDQSRPSHSSNTLTSNAGRRPHLTVLALKGADNKATLLQASAPSIQPFLERHLVEFTPQRETASQLPRMPLEQAHDSSKSRPQTALSSSQRIASKTARQRPNSAASIGGWGPWSDELEAVLVRNNSPDESRWVSANVSRPTSTPPDFPISQRKVPVKTYSKLSLTTNLQVDAKQTRHSCPQIKGEEEEVYGIDREGLNVASIPDTNCAQQPISTEFSRESVRAENSIESLPTELWSEHAWPVPSLSVQVRTASPSKVPRRSGRARTTHFKQTNAKSAHEVLRGVDGEDAGILHIEPYTRRQDSQFFDQGGANATEGQLAFEECSAHISDDEGIDVLPSDGDAFLNSVLSCRENAGLDTTGEQSASPRPRRWTSAGRAMGLHEDPFFRVSFEFDAQTSVRTPNHLPHGVDLLDFHQYQQSMKKRTQYAEKQSQRITRAQALLFAKVASKAKLPYRSPLEHNSHQHPGKSASSDGPGRRFCSRATEAGRGSELSRFSLTPEFSSSLIEFHFDAGAKRGLTIWHGNDRSEEDPLPANISGVKKGPNPQNRRSREGDGVRAATEHAADAEQREGAASDMLVGYRSSLFMRPSRPPI